MTAELTAAMIGLFVLLSMFVVVAVFGIAWLLRELLP